VQTIIDPHVRLVDSPTPGSQLPTHSARALQLFPLCGALRLHNIHMHSAFKNLTEVRRRHSSTHWWSPAARVYERDIFILKEIAEALSNTDSRKSIEILSRLAKHKAVIVSKAARKAMASL